MPNRLTKVPGGPAPMPGGAMAPLVVVADLFMGLMLSRPGGLSLRSAWVTPASLLLTTLCAPIAGLLAVLLVLRGGAVWTLCAVLIALTGLGSSAVATVGIWQRRQG